LGKGFWEEKLERKILSEGSGESLKARDRVMRLFKGIEEKGLSSI